ncbi:chorismate mutase 2, cytosolic-like [Phragmites australis]|uniref:chorismate mutase 2, cytosolic-like n=1 Tax=Phragmites australis TaxID=29695 RepID=UPI002D78D706|nr:chorismate mutase 2, cytosolic-like [Phragmites australis]
MVAFSIHTPVLCSAALLLLHLYPCAGLSLDTVRDFLTREEDTIVFSLIERARYPLNRPAYDPVYLGAGAGAGRRLNASFAELFVHESEAVQSKAGRYRSLEEIPFFAYRVPFTLAPPYNFTSELYPAAAFVNVNDAIWSAYFNDLLPVLAKNGDDGNYAVTVDSDLSCLQALSRRINYGRFVAEVKFRGDQQSYISLIQSKDRDALMKLLTSEAQEDAVKRRVEKKAMVFGQSITLDGPTETSVNNSSQANFKVDPSIVYKLYDQWVIPLTKQVEVEYLLHRLD